MLTGPYLVPRNCASTNVVRSASPATVIWAKWYQSPTETHGLTFATEQQHVYHRTTGRFGSWALRGRLFATLSVDVPSGAVNVRPDIASGGIS